MTILNPCCGSATNGFSENFVVVDIESTDLDVERCGILEIGAVDVAGRRFYRRVALGRGRRVAWQALECNGIDALDLGDGVSIDTALCDLLSWLLAEGYLGRWIMGGKNPQFDYGLLKANWPKNAAEPLHEVISRRCVDLHSLAYGMALRSGWDMTGEGFSTDDLYRLLGLEPEPMPHNALRGAVHEMEGFRRVLLGAAGAVDQKVFDSRMAALERGNLEEQTVVRDLSEVQAHSWAYGSSSMPDAEGGAK